MKEKTVCLVTLTLDSTTVIITWHNGAEHTHHLQVAERKVKEFVKAALNNATVNVEKNLLTFSSD